MTALKCGEVPNKGTSQQNTNVQRRQLRSFLCCGEGSSKKIQLHHNNFAIVSALYSGGKIGGRRTCAGRGFHVGAVSFKKVDVDSRILTWSRPFFDAVEKV